MKMILIPTDFSLAAKNAARYAMHLAKEMHANIKLCNAVMVPVEVPLAAYVTVPLVTFEAMEEAAQGELKRTANKMAELDQIETASDTYHPVIDYEVGIGSVSYVVTNLVHNYKVNLVVMGMTGASGVMHFLFGSNSRAMVEATNFPVLFVPFDASYRKLNKIAFATDLSKADITVIHVLAGFARVFNAEILLVHISDDAPDGDSEFRKKIDEFLTEVTNKVNYHKIYYQHVLNERVGDGLDWLAEYGQIQILAMVHRKQNILYRLFKGSYTQRVRKQIEIPLMVFPPDCKNQVL